MGGPLVVCNPTAGRRSAEVPLRRMCAELGVECAVPRDPGELQALARHAADEGRDRVIVAGGDGTLQLAVEILAGTDCALGIIPTGTGNDLARALGIERAPRRALRRALAGHRRRIDLGRVAGRPFTCVGATGIDGEVLGRLRGRSGRPPGGWAYAWAVVRALRSFVPPRVRVEYDGGTFDGRVTLVALANAPAFGGGMRVAPDARLDDGELDLVIVREIPRLRLLALFPRIYRGSHVTHPAVACHRVREARLRSDRRLAVHGDGEPLARLGPETSVCIDVWPASLTVVS